MLVLAVAVAGCTAENATWREPRQSDSASPAPATPPFQGWSDPAGVGRPYGTKVNGLLTFRGNPTRTFYGHSADRKAKRSSGAGPAAG